jgi:iron(III) transport system substrate-binding protein
MMDDAIVSSTGQSPALPVWRGTRVCPVAARSPAAPTLATMIAAAPTTPGHQRGDTMRNTRFAALAAATLCAGTVQAQDAGQLNVICSVQAEWCNMIQTVFAKSTGIKVNMSMKGSGEALAQLIAEKANPKTDVWFGGTGDPHLQAAELGLTIEYKSPALPQLFPWAQQQAAQSGYKTVGIYSGPLGFGYNPELLAKKKMAVPKSWADLLKPEYKGEIQVANPASSGTAYTMVATLVQLMGEDKAFDYMKALHKNIGQYTRSGTGPIKAVARGETAVSISFVHDGPGEKMQGFPVETITPSEGTGAEIGSMSIIKGARNLEQAKKFYEWALTPQAQQFGAATRQFQLPSNKATPVDPRVPDFKSIKFINYDYAKYGASAERKRLISKWEKDVNSLPR